MPSEEKANTNLTELFVYNSLTSSKTKFLTQKPGLINWYACGPTVYSSAHLGHARAYITFDIIRRILEDYFGYTINYVMNITDVDDKIILQARRNYLFKRWCSNIEQRPLNEILKFIEEAFDKEREKLETSIKKLEKEISFTKSSNQIEEKRRILEGEKLKISDLNELQNKVYEKKNQLKNISTTKITSNEKIIIDELVNSCKDVISTLLDFKHHSEITDHRIFQEHSQHYEREFFQDMKALSIRNVDCLTRVTEFIPQIIDYIQKIIDNGFAYESKGSVYFDIREFLLRGANYPKLRPNQLGNEALLSEGEGSLQNSTSIAFDKRNSSDFALQKKSKLGEPSQSSPQGDGRPGWHIECSAMASTIIGSTLDIHSGGEDLCFPHHDNEMAQAEAYYYDKNSNCDKEKFRPWVNYFLHAGHLSINGLKMAKSLKNFITIRQALKTHTSRQIRICFLLQSWNKNMEYSTVALQESVTKEKQIRDFFMNLNAIIRGQFNFKNDQFLKMDFKNENQNDRDFNMNEKIICVQQDVRLALLDNLDYPRAMRLLFDLITSTNIYMVDLYPKTLILEKVGRYVYRMFSIFGLFDNTNTNSSQTFVNSEMCIYSNEQSSIMSGFGVDLSLQEYQQAELDQLTQFRDRVRYFARLKNLAVDDIFKEFNKIVKLSHEKEVLSNIISMHKGECYNEVKSDDKIIYKNQKQQKLFSIQKVCQEFLDKIGNFSEKIQNVSDNEEINIVDFQQYLLKFCDELRDDILPAHGVKIEDDAIKYSFKKDDNDNEILLLRSIQKLDDPEHLLAERAEQKSLELSQRLKKLENKIISKRNLLDRCKQALQMSIQELFKQKYSNINFSRFDPTTNLPSHIYILANNSSNEISHKSENGIVNVVEHDEQEISKKQMKKYQKDLKNFQQLKKRSIELFFAQNQDETKNINYMKLKENNEDVILENIIRDLNSEYQKLEKEYDILFKQKEA